MQQQSDEVSVLTKGQTPAAPRYVLLEGKHPVGPEISPTPSGITCLAVYGFSGKPAYDRFIANSDRELRPYPLMKGYLQNQAAAKTSGLNLLVLDADGPSQPIVMAVTMNSALMARSAEPGHGSADYQLNLVPQTNTYRVVTGGDNISAVNQDYPATD